jgi:hypothetical protein
MRVTFLTPNMGTAKLSSDPSLLVDVLGLVGVAVTAEAVAAWSYLERVLVYDWAMREHLGAADNPVRRRERPALLPRVAVSEAIADPDVRRRFDAWRNP